MKKKIILISFILIAPSCFFQQGNINNIVKNEAKNISSIEPKNNNTVSNKLDQKVDDNRINNDIKTSSTPNTNISTTPSSQTLERSNNFGGGGSGGGGGAVVKPISTNIIGQIKEDEVITSTPIPSTNNDVGYSSNSGSQISGQVKK